MSPQQQQQLEHQLPPRRRERGTPKDVSSLPRAKHAIGIIIFVGLLSATLATALFLYSSPFHTTSTPDTTTITTARANGVSIVKLVFLAALGSSSTLVGIIFGDSLSHAFAFGIGVSSPEDSESVWVIMDVVTSLIGIAVVIIIVNLALMFLSDTALVVFSSLVAYSALVRQWWHRHFIVYTRGLATVTTGHSRFDTRAESHTIIIGLSLKQWCPSRPTHYRYSIMLSYPIRNSDTSIYDDDQQFFDYKQIGVWHCSNLFRNICDHGVDEHLLRA
jgi:hypothetical protein